MRQDASFFPFAPAHPEICQDKFLFPFAPTQPWNLPGQIPLPLAPAQPWNHFDRLQTKARGAPDRFLFPLAPARQTKLARHYTQPTPNSPRRVRPPMGLTIIKGRRDNSLLLDLCFIAPTILTEPAKHYTRPTLPCCKARALRSRARETTPLGQDQKMLNLLVS
jgi:hypothetical protein